ncbi:MAG: phage scaffolding protein [Lachnospiraceae bacterium]|nr:phage scaffolding protein [Lachnospiraceae bacterium]
MRNIFEIMKEYGLEVPEDKKQEFEAAVLENYRTMRDYEEQKTALDSAGEKLKTADATMKRLEKELGEYKDADVSGLKKQIEDLNEDLKKKDEEYQRQISDRDFDDLLKDSISQAKGRNAKAITALLDVEKLKESKNQKDDVAAALKALSEQEDSKMLFGEPDPKPVGNGNLIGQVTGGAQTYDDARMRAVMGLPPVQAGIRQEG